MVSYNKSVGCRLQEETQLWERSPALFATALRQIARRFTPEGVTACRANLRNGGSPTISSLENQMVASSHAPLFCGSYWC